MPGDDRRQLSNSSIAFPRAAAVEEPLHPTMIDLFHHHNIVLSITDGIIN
jgi:hypothetical protein